MITRKIGKLLRGKATPVQIYLACVLGAMIGFIPGFSQAPGLLLFLLLLLIILNANLFLAGVVGLGAKLLSFLLLPVSFAAGRLLLDGPTQPLFKGMINAPVLAFFGFDHYVVTGGMLIAILLGVGAGVLVSSMLRSFRARMASMEEGSERYQKFNSKRWVRVLVWIFLGKGHGKKTYAELASKKIGNPIRPLGVVFAILVVALLFIARGFASEPIVTAALTSGLERANGATVDLGRADLKLSEGRLTVTDLAMADAAALETDLFRAAEMEHNISTTDLLRKRIAFDRVLAQDASQGETRLIPGRIVGREPQPAPPPPVEPGEKTLDDYLAEAEVWRERLAQARKWIERITSEGAEPTDAPVGETLRERLAREAAELGYARVKATHLIEGAPTVLVRELEINGVRIKGLSDDVLDVRGENLSSQPWLLAEASSLIATSRSGQIDAAVRRDAGGASTISFLVKGVSVDSFAGKLTARPIRGGTMDIAFNGSLSGAFIDAPLLVTLHNTTITFSGAGSQQVSRFEIPIHLRGPIDNPRILLDEKTLADALVKAGAGELADKVRGEIESKVEEKLGEQLRERLPGGLRERLGGDRKEEGGGQ